MSKKPKELKKALLYLGRGEYSRVIRLLEPKIPLFLENKEFYTILAKAFYYTGDYAGSKLYFDRGQKIVWDIDSALYLGVLGLKRRDFNSSIRIWLDILDEDPENKVAKRGLDALKRYSTMEELEAYIHSKKVEKLIPKKPIRLAPSTIVSLSLIPVLILGGVIVVKSDIVSRVSSLWESGAGTVERRDGQEHFDLESFDRDFLDFDEKSQLTFTGAQIEEFFKTAEELFIYDKDNLVRTYINLIKYSNANMKLKSQAEKLESYLVDPDWSNYSDDFTFKDVNNNLLQYENCIVKWKGSVSNLSINGKIVFDLLVGYDKKRTLEGVVSVVYDENILIDDSLPVEVLGKIKLNSNGFYIEALIVSQYATRK